MKNLSGENIISWALTFVFVWFGSNEIINPAGWVGFVPSFIGAGIQETAIVIHGVILVICALGIVIGIGRFYFAILAALILLSIVITLLTSNGVNPTSVRDIGLFGSAVALIFLSKKPKAEPLHTNL